MTEEQKKMVEYGLAFLAFAGAVAGLLLATRDLWLR